MDGEVFLSESTQKGQYDFIFADTWPGKYYALDEALACLACGGLYVIDDMNPCADWPEGHLEKATSLVDYLTKCPDVNFAYYTFGTGVGIAQKKIEI